MSGSLLGRGRGGRLAVYAGCASLIILMIFVYRAAVTEMTRLRDLHEQCALNQESLQQQLQVIFEYKVRLEKSLADETSENAAVKQELQQRATMEKSHLDKVTVEAEQRYNSLQQSYKVLETEHHDLEEECERRKKLASENSTRLETTLQELRTELRQVREDNVQSLENLRNKYLQIEIEKSKIEQKYNEILLSNGNADMNAQRLEKQVSQLREELEDAKRSCEANRAPSSPSAGAAPEVGGNVQNVDSRAAGSQNAINLARPPSQSLQQVSPPSDENGKAPQPIQAPRDHLPIAGSPKIDRVSQNEPNTDVRFEQQNGMVVPVGQESAIDKNDGGENDLNVLPMPYSFKGREGGKVARDNTANKVAENVGDIPQEGNAGNINNNNSDNVLAAPYPVVKSSSTSRPRAEESLGQIPIVKIQDEMQVLQDKIEGVDNNNSVNSV